MKTFKAIADEIQNVQIYPSTIRVEPNDKVTKLLFNFDAETFAALTEGAGINVTEAKHHKKHGKIKSSFKVQANNSNPLTEFDRAVLSVCISEMEAGNCYTTPSIIYRALTGKVGNSETTPYKNQLDAIIKSVDKLMFAIFDPKVADAFEKLNYGDGEFSVAKSPILPCQRLAVNGNSTITVNGQAVNEIVYFLTESPLMKIADAKSQIIRYDTALLNDSQRNTPLIITLKNYVIRRVFEVKGDKRHKLTPTVTFDDIFKKARISDASKHVKLDARSAVENFFVHLAKNDVIKSFEIVKRGNQIHAVNFAY